MTYDNLKPAHCQRIFMFSPGIITISNEDIMYDVNLEKKNLYPTRVRNNQIHIKGLRPHQLLHHSGNILIC